MSTFAITAIGKDQPGIVCAVTEVLYQHRCNIEDSSMTILRGEFAMIMIVSAPAHVAIAKLKRGYRAAEKRLGLYVHLKKIELPRRKQKKAAASESEYSGSHVISLLGADQPGLIYHLSRLLAGREINITDVNTRILGDAKKPMYAMLIEIVLPDERLLGELGRDLKKLALELNAEITIKPVDVVQC